MTVDETFEIRRYEKMTVATMIAEGESPEKANAYMKGERLGYSWCFADFDAAPPELKDEHFAHILEVGRIDVDVWASVIDVISIALQLSPKQRAHAYGFLLASADLIKA